MSLTEVNNNNKKVFCITCGNFSDESCFDLFQNGNRKRSCISCLSNSKRKKNKRVKIEVYTKWSEFEHQLMKWAHVVSCLTEFYYNKINIDF